MKALLAAAALVLTAGVAHAGSFQLGAEWTVPAGFYNGYGNYGPLLCTEGNYATVTPDSTPSHGVICNGSYPGGYIIGFTGTATIKKPGIEVLAYLTCGNGTRMWQGEFIGPATLVVEPGVPLLAAKITGPCQIGFESIGPARSRHDFGTPYRAADFEMQITIFYEEAR